MQSRWNLKMFSNCLITASILTLALASVASGSQVNEITGPFRVVFEMPGTDEINAEIADPLLSDTFTWYALTVPSDKWFINMVLTDYKESHEIDNVMERRSVAASTGGEKSQVSERIIDGKNAIIGMVSGPSGTTYEVAYWLDESGSYGTKKVEITIASDYESNDKIFQEGLNKMLDTLKITY